MGREVKRVSMDFDWPMGRVWHGYLTSTCLDPPLGEGFQMWETVSEGSPISPVFKTPEELAKWLADNGASAFGSETATYEQWLKMITGPGWSPSAMVVGGVMMSGVQGVTTNDNK
jgi:hypothetical protein